MGWVWVKTKTRSGSIPSQDQVQKRVMSESRPKPEEGRFLVKTKTRNVLSLS